ncbi:hypothetical protein GTA08_BOTSDO10497 [Neofusicoccum parvum]|nr:hypothetical protein GTA08_BOTSDO10497 [Neofusicoccum parvum]
MDTTVTEADIEAWDGNLDWLPSFSLVEFHEAEGRTSFLDAIPGAGTLTASTSEYQRDREIITQLYRVTASIYRRQSLGDSSDSITADAESSSSLASLAIQLIHHLPQGSPYENALLWPIGICGRELTSYHAWERQYTIFRLQLLEKRFRMKHFQRAQQVLANNWRRKDQEAVHEFVAGSHWQRDMILLG